MLAHQLTDIIFDYLCAGDVKTIARMDRLCFPEDYWTPAVFREELANPLAKYLVAKYRKHIVGYGGIWLLANEAHIVNLAVHPGWRGIGLGKALLARMMALAIVRNLTLASLLVRASNFVAQKLYQSVGFTLHHVAPSYYEDGEDGWLMTLPLPGLSQND